MRYFVIVALNYIEIIGLLILNPKSSSENLHGTFRNLTSIWVKELAISFCKYVRNAKLTHSFLGAKPYFVKSKNAAVFGVSLVIAIQSRRRQIVVCTPSFIRAAACE